MSERAVGTPCGKNGTQVPVQIRLSATESCPRRKPSLQHGLPAVTHVTDTMFVPHLDSPV